MTTALDMTTLKKHDNIDECNYSDGPGYSDDYVYSDMSA